MKNLKSSNIVIHYIVDLIVRREIIPGGKLPSTENLSKLTGTSIITAREAVQILACIGLIEVSHGRGMFLTKGKPVFEDLLLARGVIEPNTVMMATRNLDADSLEKLESLLGQMENYAKDGDAEAFSTMDYEFHVHLCRIAGNRILSKTIENIGELLYYQQSAINRFRPNVPQQSLIRHREIFEAMKRGDPDGAGKLMAKHIAEVSESWSMLLPVS